jgi:O-antigen/teichoic acid export membrane protein
LLNNLAQKSIGGKLSEAGTHTFIYGMGAILQGVLGYILIPLYTKELSTELFGVFSMLIIFGTFAGVIFYLGASSALSRSYYDYNDPGDRRRVVGTSLFLSFIGATTQCSIGLVFSSEISMLLFDSYVYHNEVVIVLFSSAATFLNNLLLNVLRFERKSTFVIVSNLVALLVSTGLISYFIIVANMGILGAVLGTCLGQLVLLISLLFKCRKLWSPFIIKKEILIQLKFGLPSVLIGASYVAITSVDRFVLSEIGTLSDVGIYSLGYKFGTIIHILFIMPFSQIFAPMRIEYRNDKNAKEFFKLITTYYFIMGVTMMVMISIFSYEIIYLVSQRDEYLNAYLVIPIIMLGHIFYGSMNILDAGITFERKVMWNAYILIGGSVVSAVLNYIFTPIFGYLGSSFVALFVFLLIALVVWQMSNRLYEINLELKRICKIVLAGVFTIAVAFNLNGITLFIAIFLKLICMIFFIAVIYKLILNIDEKNKLVTKLRTLIGMKI